MAILLFFLIPFSYGITLPLVYWVHQFLLFILLLTLAFINTRWLAPNLLFSRKFFQYYSILFLVCIFIIIILWQAEIWLNIPQAMKQAAEMSGVRQREEGKGISVSFYILMVEILVLGVNISGIIIKKWEEEKNIRLEVEKDKIEMELSFLKSQINPHFFFNSLNTINALTYSNVEQSRTALKKLGKIMRYVLYNTSNESSTLKEEIEFIRIYLDLMRMRMGHRVSIDFSTEITSFHKRIAPMLFLSLIENCFKHGLSTQTDSPISIRISEEGSHIIFQAKNKIFGRTVYGEKDVRKIPGIGIKNTKRRLDLLYSGKYSFSIKENDEFEVFLKIQLDEN